MGKQAETALRSRIVGEGDEAPDQLLANPLNWRRHPKEQQAALEGLLREVGWVQRVIVNRTTGHIVDGHLRVELAMRRNEPSVPVLYVELTEDEEKVVLAAIDPIGGLAETDQAMLDSLISGMTTGDTDLDEFIDSLRSKEMTPDLDQELEQAGVDLKTQFLIPPLSVLDARQGYWQTRKKTWISLGIKSEEGRGNDESRDNKNTGGLLMKSWTAHPAFYKQKTDKEKELGRKLNTAEFAENYFVIPDDGLSSGTSVFDPVLCEIAYRWFAPQSAEILDPFAGGSVRGIVAAMLGHHYVGIDLRDEQVQANRRQWESLRMPSAFQGAPVPRWIAADSRTLDQQDVGEVDLVFSCPPYADLEVYSDDDRDLSNLEYEKFREVYFQIIAKSCAKLRQHRFAVFVVGEVRGKRGAYYDFVGDTIRAFQAAGLDYYNEAVLVTSVGSVAMRVAKQMMASRKIGKTHQNVLIFKKGDPSLGADIDSIAAALADTFVQNRELIDEHLKVLVFSKGDPKIAAQEFGPPKMDDPATEYLLTTTAEIERDTADPAEKYGEIQ